MTKRLYIHGNDQIYPRNERQAQWKLRPRKRVDTKSLTKRKEIGAVEYINGEWYWITWEDDDWWTCKKARVKTPRKYGLETTAPVSGDRPPSDHQQ